MNREHRGDEWWRAVDQVAGISVESVLLAGFAPDALEDSMDERCCVREQLVCEVWGLVDPV